MDNTIKSLKKIKIDSLYRKKKHFNATDRIEKSHFSIGLPLIVINVITGSILFSILTDNEITWIKYIPPIFSFIAAILSSFQTYFNFPKIVEGHRRVGNKFLSVMKQCDILQSFIADNLINDENLILEIKNLTNIVEEINKEAESYPTSKKDFLLAKQEIDSGDETYTETELEL
ncbi:MAG: SLATT domain-containing protein [Melioribacteraceae bacterium]